MPEHGSQPETSKPNYRKRQVVAFTTLAAVLTGGGFVIKEILDSSSDKESTSSSECLKVDEVVETISGSVTIPAGINRNTSPFRTPDNQTSTYSYSDKTEIVTEPVELTVEETTNGDRVLCYKNDNGKYVFVLETHESEYQITVTNGAETKPLAQARVQPGGITSTTVRSIHPDGSIYASANEHEEPKLIAAVQDRG